MWLPRPWKRGPRVPVETVKRSLQRRHSVHQSHRALGRFDFWAEGGSRKGDHHGAARTWRLKGAEGSNKGGTYPRQTIGPPHFRQIIGGDDGMISCSVQAR